MHDTHTHTVSVVCPSECRLLLTLSEAVAAGCGSSLTAQHWVETASNGSHWQTATVSPIIKTTNTDLHFTVYFVTGVICHNPSTSHPYVFIGGHLKGDSYFVSSGMWLINDNLDLFSKYFYILKANNLHFLANGLFCVLKDAITCQIVLESHDDICRQWLRVSLCDLLWKWIRQFIYIYIFNVVILCESLVTQKHWHISRYTHTHTHTQSSRIYCTQRSSAWDI